MFIYDFKNNKLPDMDEFKYNLDLEVFLVNDQYSKQSKYKDTIYSIFINFGIFEYLNLDSGSILEKFNKAFKLVEQNISESLKLKLELEKIVTLIDSYDFESKDFDKDKFLIELQEGLVNYYKLKSELIKTIIEKDSKIQELIKKLEIYKPISLDYSDPLKMDKEILVSRQEEKSKLLDKSLDKSTDVSIKTNYTVLKNPLDDSISNDSIEKDDKEILDKDEPHLGFSFYNKLKDNNVLLVSEADDMVYLPYQISDLEFILNQSPDDYKNIDELISNEYILPLSIFKNPYISRFKEGYRLIRTKERGSIRESLSVGLELMNNDKLHPAIIAACRNEDELYTYLDCLEKNQTEDFKHFEIKFDITPTTK